MRRLSSMEPDGILKFSNTKVRTKSARMKATNMASYLEIDAVIDPADTRKWITEGLKAAAAERTKRAGHDFVDTW